MFCLLTFNLNLKMEDEYIEQSEGYQSGLIDPESDLFQKWRLDNRQILEEIENGLAGRYRDPATNLWVEAGEPLLNEQGRKRVLTIMTPYIDKTVALSYLTDTQINEMGRQFSEQLWEELVVNKEIWQVEMLGAVADMLDSFVLAALRRALDGATNKSLTETIRTHQVDRVIGEHKRSWLPQLGGSRHE
ncbi:MAG: hypothetical protein COC02_05475 [Rhodospirillaceae bacterium]|nr:MAG: hypothetical protein COC02_05475 [Rhodospirillaceae bacterium]